VIAGFQTVKWAREFATPGSKSHLGFGVEGSIYRW
jgi:hypothetical protein